MRRVVLPILVVAFIVATAVTTRAATSTPAEWVQSFWPAAQAAGVSRSVYDAALGNFAPDPDVIKKAATQAEFNMPIWNYIDMMVSDERISGRQGGPRQIWRHARQDRGALRRRPLHRGGDLGDGIALRNGAEQPEARQEHHPLAGDACLFRRAPRQIRAPAAGRGAADRPARRRYRQGHDRLLGRRHGPDPVHPDHLQRLRRRFRRRRPPQHLDLAGRRARLDRQLPQKIGLAAGRDLGLRGGAAGRLQPQEIGHPHACRLAQARHRSGRRQGLSAARRPRQPVPARRATRDRSSSFSAISRRSSTTTMPTAMLWPSAISPIACAAAGRS